MFLFTTKPVPAPKIFQWLLISFLVGIGLGSSVPLSGHQFAIGALTAAAMVWILPRRWAWVGGCLLVLLLGMARYTTYQPVWTVNDIASYVGQRVIVTGTIVSGPDPRLGSTQFTIAVEMLESKAGTRAAAGNILVTAGLFPEYQFGDRIRLSGLLKAPEPFEGFRYDRYLAVRHIYTVSVFPRLEKISVGKVSAFSAALAASRQRLTWVMLGNMHEPQASLLSALLLGDPHGIPVDLRRQFALTGTSHLVAISGSHLTLLLAMIQQVGFAIGLSRRQVAGPTAVILFFYLALIGFQASAVRAGIMGGLFLVAGQLGRANNSINAWLIAAVAMVSVNPLLLRDDVGFQLSFLASLSILFFSAWVQRGLAWLPNQFGLAAILSTTLAAQIGTVPLMIWQLGQLSLIAPVSNLLVLSAMEFALLAGLITVGISLVFPPFAPAVFWPLELLLQLVIWLVRLTSEIPGGALQWQ